MAPRTRRARRRRSRRGCRRCAGGGRSSPSLRGSPRGRRAARGGRARTRRPRRVRARRHECEMGARQLEQERPRRNRPLQVGTSRSAVGHRFPARAPALTATSMPEAPSIAATSAVVDVLPAVPVIPIVSTLPALEQQVAEARDAAALRPQALDAGRDLGRPHVEVGDLGRAGIRSSSACGLDRDAELLERLRLRRRTPAPAMRTSCPSSARKRPSASASASNPSTRTVATDR